MTKNENHDDASSVNTINGGVARPWSDLYQDVLLLIMMHLGVFDFLAFVGVCKSWKSVAVSNKNKFLATRAPMAISFSTNEDKCCLTDFEKKKLTLTLPLTIGRTCVGLTCGYLIMFCKHTHDFWLLNPVKRHKLHFPDIPFDEFVHENFSAIIVFLPLTSEWVLAVFIRNCYDKIWFCIAGQREWTKLSTSFRILDLQAFKGKLYALHYGNRLSEVRLYPTPKVTFLEIKNFPMPDFDHPVLVRSGENLNVMDLFSKNAYKIISLGKVEGVTLEKIGDEFALFFSRSIRGGFVISDLGSQYKRYAVTVEGPKRKIFNRSMWYFFHDCLNVNLLHE